MTTLNEEELSHREREAQNRLIHLQEQYDSEHQGVGKWMKKLDADYLGVKYEELDERIEEEDENEDSEGQDFRN
jgi:hypothetical protein